MADFTDTVSIELQQSTKPTSTGIAKVINDLKQLHHGMSVGATGTHNLQRQFKDLAISLHGTKLKSSISSINSDLLRYVTTTGDVITVNRKMKDNTNSYTVSLKKLNKELDNNKNKNMVLPKPDKYGSMDSQLSKLGIDLKDSELISTLKDVNSELTKYKLKTGEVVTVQKKLVDGQERVKVSVRKVNKELKDSNNYWKNFSNGISNAILKTKLAYHAIKNTMTTIFDIIGDATAYEEALNLFTVSMGENAKEATKWVEMFSNALYLDSSNVMQYMGSLNSLIGGLGVGAEKSYLMSKNLTQLAYDLASFKNMKFEEAFTKLQSGISGEIEPLRNVGVALSQNTLQELANSLGIKQRVAEMSEAQKAQLRYIQIIKSTTQWQGDMGRTLMTPANALRVAREQFTLLGRAIGQVFLPIVMKSIPYIMALTEVLTDLAKKLSQMLGYKPKEVDYSSLKTMTSTITGIGDEAEKTTDKLNTMLAPFDELNVVQNQSKSGAGGLGIGGDLGLNLPEYNALEGLTEEMSKSIEEAKNNLNKLLDVAIVLGATIATWKVGSGILKFASMFAKGGVLYTGFHVIKDLFVLTLIPAFNTAIGAIGAFVATLGAPEIAVIGATLIGIGLAIEGISLATKKAIRPVEMFDEHISEVSRVKLTPLLKEMRKLDDTIVGLELKSLKLDDETITTIKNQVASIRKSIVDELDSDRNDDLKNLKPLEKALGKDAFAELETSINTYYDNKVNKVTENEKKINEIIAEARGQENGITKEQLEKIQSLREEMNSIGIQSMTENEDEYLTIMARLKSNAVATSVEQASEIIKNAKKTKEDTIVEAEKQYDGIINQAKRMLDAGIINQTQYDSIVSSAEKTRDETIKTANEQYDGIINATKTKLGENSKYIDLESGKVKSNWNVFCDGVRDKWNTMWTNIKSELSKAWDNIKKFWNDHIAKWFTLKHWQGLFNDAVKGVETGINNIKKEFENFTAKIKTPHFEWVEGGVKAKGWMKDALEALNLPTSIPKLKVNWYAEGGFPQAGELFVAREAGAEMVGRIGNQTAVANNDQITTAITNALITALSEYGFGNNQPGTTVVNIGGRKVYEGVGDYVDSENDRYGTNYINV